MDDLLLTSAIAALGLAIAGALVLRRIRLARRRHAQARRAEGYRLIHALRSYSAWIESQRDLPFTSRSLEELTSPETLTRASRIKSDWFPSLSQHMVPLLQAHSRMVEYLWEQSLLRLSQGSGWQPACQDAQYQRLRGTLEDLIDEMIGLCRELIGDSTRPWQHTGSDFVFSSSVGLPSQGPARGA
jgi:hypothetical protein